MSMQSTDTVAAATDGTGARELSFRQSASPWRLLAQAAGGPRQWWGKGTRLVRTLGIYFRRGEVHRRLERLRWRGFITEPPSALQLAVGGLDMLRYFITPGARDYYETRGIDFTFHQVLRILDDPVSMIDPVGVLSDRDTIIGHILQVVHANPIYDLQLLEMFDDGVDELERQAEQLVAGTHPRARTIGAIVEDPAYHSRLLDYLRRYRRDPNTPELRRQAGSAREDFSFVLAEETFGTLPGAMRYMARLPRDSRGALAHLRQRKAIAPEYCDPEVRAAVQERFATSP